MGEWPSSQLGDLVEIFDGPHATPKKTNAGPTFLGISNLVGGRLDLSETEHLSEESFAQWTRRVTPAAGDVVFSYETRLGEAALIPVGLRCCLGRRMGLLRPKSGKVDSHFLLYAYLGPEFQETIRQRTIHGSTVDRIPLIEMPRFPIRVPPLPEQRAIAHVLGALDDKIELNRKMSETLEELTRTLFKSWFVDFDPVHAKAAGKKPFGMDDATAALFPDSFEDSELGPIPRGWRVGTLGELTSMLTRGRAPKYSDEGLLILNQKCIRSGRVSFEKARRTEADSGRWGDRALAVGDVLVNSTGVGTLGRVAQVTWLPEPASFDTHVTALRAADNVDPTFFGVGQLMKERVYEALGEGSTGQTELSRGRIAAELVVLPPEIVQRRFGEIMGPFRERSAQTERESLTLAELRDTLLPKLLSGELRVPLDVVDAPTATAEQLGLFENV